MLPNTQLGCEQYTLSIDHPRAMKEEAGLSTYFFFHSRQTLEEEGKKNNLIEDAPQMLR